MVEGMSTALAASAKWAKTPNLLGDIVGCIQEESQVIENEEMLQVQSLEVDETKEGDASAHALRLPPRHLSREGPDPEV